MTGNEGAGRPESEPGDAAREGMPDEPVARRGSDGPTAGSADDRRAGDGTPRGASADAAARGRAGGRSAGDAEAGRPDAGRAAAGGDAAELLNDVRRIRHAARLARHAYWFPLVVFGILTAASVPFYLRRLPASGVTGYHAAPPLGGNVYLAGRGPFATAWAGWYWLIALLAGLAATAAWYRWRGGRVGLRSPARGYVIVGLALLGVVLLIPVLGMIGHGPGVLVPGDLVGRGTFPFVIIAVGLCYLAWAERSVGLGIIASGYLALAIVVSLYDLANVLYRLGWPVSPQQGRLPNVVLPAAVLLLAGIGAGIAQWRHRPPPPAAEEARAA